MVTLGVLVRSLVGCWDYSSNPCSKSMPSLASVPATLAQSKLTATLYSEPDHTLRLSLTNDAPSSGQCAVFDATATMNGVAMVSQSQGEESPIQSCNEECSALDFTTTYDPQSTELDVVVTDASGSFRVNLPLESRDVTLPGSNVFLPGAIVTVDVSTPIDQAVASVQSPDGTQTQQVDPTVAADGTSFSFAMPAFSTADRVSYPTGITGCAQTSCVVLIKGSVYESGNAAVSKCDFDSCVSQLPDSFSLPILISVDDAQAPNDAGSPDASANDGG